LDVSERGRLKLKLRPGEYVQVGDARVTFLEHQGDALYAVFEGPRSVPIGRAGRLSDSERRRYSRPSRRSA
jgi:hypothetical protein